MKPDIHVFWNCCSCRITRKHKTFREKRFHMHELMNVHDWRVSVLKRDHAVCLTHSVASFVLFPPSHTCRNWSRNCTSTGPRSSYNTSVLYKSIAKILDCGFKKNRLWCVVRSSHSAGAFCCQQCY